MAFGCSIFSISTSPSIGSPCLPYQRLTDHAKIASLLVWLAQEPVEAAEQALAIARKHEPQRLVGQLLGDQALSGPTVEECEKALAQAHAAVDHAIRMRDALDGQ